MGNSTIAVAKINRKLDEKDNLSQPISQVNYNPAIENMNMGEIPPWAQEEFPVDLYDLPSSPVISNDAEVPKPKRGRPKGSASPLLLADKQRDLINWMSGSKITPMLSGCDPFDKRFKCFFRDREKGISELIEVKNGLAKTISPSVLFTELWARMGHFSGEARNYMLTLDQADKVAEFYTKTHHAQFLENPPPIFCWESESDKIAFNRIRDPADISTFYPSSEFRQLAPIYSDYLDRCQHPNTKRQFLGSLLDPKAPRKKILWDWGGSNAGKSTMLLALLRGIFGERGFVCLDMIDPENDPFWKESLVGKLAVFIDEANPGFLRSNIFKQLTGTSTQRINPKGEKTFNAELNFKVMFASNPQPTFPRESGILARMISNEIKPLVNLINPNQIAEQLHAEFPYIIADIKFAHEEQWGFDIETPAGNHDSSIAQFNETLQMVFDACFDATDKETEEVFEVSSAAFMEKIRHYCNGRDVTESKMRDFVRETYNSRVGIEHRVNGKKQRWVTNIRFKC